MPRCVAHTVGPGVLTRQASVCTLGIQFGLPTACSTGRRHLDSYQLFLMLQQMLNFYLSCQLVQRFCVSKLVLKKQESDKVLL